MKKLKNIELRSEEVQTILSKVPPWLISRGISIISLVVFSIFIFSFFMKIPSYIEAETVLFKENNQWFSKSIINIKDISKITQNDKVIIYLDNYSYYEYGILNGVVNSTSFDNKKKEYNVIIFLENGLTTNQNIELEVMPLIKGHSKILVDEIRLTNMIFPF